MTTPDLVAAAKSAGLRYVSDTALGIRRLARGYRNPDGTPLREQETLDRIAALAIPPAWTDVWICPDPRGHIQATGRDAKGRKQYRYHDRWRAVRDETKYDRAVAFGRALPAIREVVARDLARQGLSREKVLATVVRLLERTLIRVGNEDYARLNDSYGLTTLRSDHAEATSRGITFSFRGKGGKDHAIRLVDRRLAGIVQRIQALPGQQLFQYLDDDGEPQAIDSSDVNEYLREASGDDFTAKDFRTWSATIIAAYLLRAAPPAESATATKRLFSDVATKTASQLGNTATICRKCYIHPAVFEAYESGAIGRLPLVDLPVEGPITIGRYAEEAVIALLDG